MAPNFCFHQFIIQGDFTPMCLLPSPGIISGCKPCEGLPQTEELMTSLTGRRVSAAPSPPQRVIALAEPISSPSRLCLCASCANRLSGERVLHCRVSHRSTACHRKALFSFPYDHNDALMQNVSRRAIKYLGWEAAASTKNTSMLAGLRGSGSVWQPINLPQSATQHKPKGFSWTKHSEQSSYLCQLMGSSSHTDPCLARGEKRLLIFSTFFLCVIRDGPRRQRFAGKNLPFDQFSEFWESAVKTSKSGTSQLEIILKCKVCIKIWAFSGAGKGKRWNFLFYYQCLSCRISYQQLRSCAVCPSLILWRSRKDAFRTEKEPK